MKKIKQLHKIIFILNLTIILLTQHNITSMTPRLVLAGKAALILPNIVMYNKTHLNLIFSSEQPQAAKVSTRKTGSPLIFPSSEYDTYYAYLPSDPNRAVLYFPIRKDTPSQFMHIKQIINSLNNTCIMQIFNSATEKSISPICVVIPMKEEDTLTVE